MKKISKIMAMALSAMLAVGGMGISAMAEEVIDLGHGITLTIRSEEEEMQRPMPRLWNSFHFDQYVGEFPEPSWLRNIDDANKSTYMDLGADESTIKMEFDEWVDEELYTAVYDVTEDRTLFDDCENGLAGPFKLNYSWTISGLTGGHTYRVGFATESGQFRLVGMATSF
ncbi:MAG TPA: hypothetical protein IAA60_08615 [Candidatus Ornithomonoglobus intestinigallinarum]|uniref:Uncharacterized protein n=1 Tax=Candidatus Ornithomonoglobus intestinigallinarum TaxID=2840894 RepID=A0A9D1H3N6_9FIRM|nr:hypothetical protein [Candidatus Ornithomonoglobus intestinigallinarum]